MGVIVIMMVVRVIVVVMVMIVMMVMLMVVVMMLMVVVMIVQVRVTVGCARVFGEYQRLDRDRHGLRRHAYAPEIDVIEVLQGHAIDDEQLAHHLHFFAQNRA